MLNEKGKYSLNVQKIWSDGEILTTTIASGLTLNRALRRVFKENRKCGGRVHFCTMSRLEYLFVYVVTEEI